MCPRPAGRPPTFDRDVAVLEAARLFWRRGYSGTSTRALSAALGLSTSSIYAAFGSKAGLFENAVHVYAERYRSIYQQACAESEFTEVVRTLFSRSIEEFTQPSENHPGCLVSSAAMTDAPETVDIQGYLCDLHASNDRLLQQRVARAKKERQVPSDVDPALLTATLQTLWHGLSAQSNQGRKRHDLFAIAELTLSNLVAVTLTLTLTPEADLTSR